MGMYEQCLHFLDDLKFSGTNNCKTLNNVDDISNTITTAPNILDTYEFSLTCRKVYYISDIHLEHKIIKTFPNGANNLAIKAYIQSLARVLFSRDLVKDIKNGEKPIVLFAGDIGSSFDIVYEFYKEFISIWDRLVGSSKRRCKKYVYAILGNHELWKFSILDKCTKAYKKMFDTLGIHFLNNSTDWLGEYKFPIKYTLNEEDGTYYSEKIIKEDDPDGYAQQSRNIHNIMIVGGLGFAGHNNDFNANRGIYRNTIDREQEIEETNKWNEIYREAIESAKENNCLLVVLTHNPILDWKEDGKPDHNCIYFNGHTHRNYIHHDNERGIHIIADNQIGYDSNIVKLQNIYIYDRVNPFTGYADGYYEISSLDYIKFYGYISEYIAGSKLIDKQIKNNDGKLYLIKYNGYYGFFLVSLKGTYICVGGRIKKIGEPEDIEKYNTSFSDMIDTYLKILYPYRNAQEQISKAVKSFGGSGRIHGCIIDIDFFNHIMLNPSDGTITYYYSPEFGTIQTYSDILSLLSERNKELESAYRKQLEINKEHEEIVLVKSQIATTEGLVKIVYMQFQIE